jgi:hypothetical protein
MNDDNVKPIRIQILAAKEEAGPGARAVAVARERLHDVADVGRGRGAEALLVCPAPEEFSSEGYDLVVGVRFGQELAPWDDFFNYIGPMLAILTDFYPPPCCLIARS